MTGYDIDYHRNIARIADAMERIAEAVEDIRTTSSVGNLDVHVHPRISLGGTEEAPPTDTQ